MAKEVFEPRRAEPNEEFVYHDAYGNRVTAKADDKGVLQPKNAAQVELADAAGLPVADLKAAPAAKET
jgi:hypothetical protein